jgi:hypothetical protein
MHELAYPLALTDRAFAYEGAYRSPAAMSCAARTAYALRTSAGATAAPVPFSAAFCAALQTREVKQPHPRARPIARPTAISVASRPRMPARAFRCIAAQQRETPLIRPSRIAQLRATGCNGHPPQIYVLSVLSSEYAVRAIVWRGRVHVGGIATCLKSTG